MLSNVKTDRIVNHPLSLLYLESLLKGKALCVIDSTDEKYIQNWRWHPGPRLIRVRSRAVGHGGRVPKSVTAGVLGYHQVYSQLIF